jgi:CRP-like cAMP-binding protein
LAVFQDFGSKDRARLRSPNTHEASVSDEIEETAGIMLVEREALVQRIPGLLDGLAEDERKRLLSIGQKRDFEAEQALFRQGDQHGGIYLIESGRIRSYYTAPSGREVTLAYWFPGNFVGAPDMFGGGTHMWGSSAVQRTGTIFLPGPELRRLALASAPIAVALLDALSFKARCYSAMAQMLGTRSATERLEHLLVFLATVYGLKERDGTVIAASFTHADLASLIGSTRQWVTVQLARLQERGIVRYNRGLLVIRQPASLGLKDRS